MIENTIAKVFTPFLSSNMTTKLLKQNLGTKMGKKLCIFEQFNGMGNCFTRFLKNRREFDTSELL